MLKFGFGWVKIFKRLWERLFLSGLRASEELPGKCSSSYSRTPFSEKIYRLVKSCKKVKKSKKNIQKHSKNNLISTLNTTNIYGMPDRQWWRIVVFKM